MIFKLLLPLAGLAMIIAGVWLYSAPEPVAATDGGFALVSEPFTDEIFTLSCTGMGSLILIMSVVRLLKKRNSYYRL